MNEQTHTCYISVLNVIRNIQSINFPSPLCSKNPPIFLFPQQKIDQSLLFPAAKIHHFNHSPYTQKSIIFSLPPPTFCPAGQNLTKNTFCIAGWVGWGYGWWRVGAFCPHAVLAATSSCGIDASINFLPLPLAKVYHGAASQFPLLIVHTVFCKGHEQEPRRDRDDVCTPGSHRHCLVWSWPSHENGTMT